MSIAAEFPRTVAVHLTTSEILCDADADVLRFYSVCIACVVSRGRYTLQRKKNQSHYLVCVIYEYTYVQNIYVRIF